MNVFETYARYYDLLYRDKDYAAEAEFVHQLIQKYRPTTVQVLDIGCGTGMHAAELAVRRYRVVGVDQSADMLKRANDKKQTLPVEVGNQLDFAVDDARFLKLDGQFDVVTALFHVVSYQTSNEDLRAMFRSVVRHLVPGGLFIFDVWYGPAVLTDRPTVRIKRLKDSTSHVTRIAEPEMHPRENVVDVNYTILLTTKENAQLHEIKEQHRMRYLFSPEIFLLCEENGLQCLESAGWMTTTPPGFDTWSVHFVSRKV